MGKTIVITGAGSGFGRRMAETLSRAGHTVFATMRHPGDRNAVAAAELREWAAEHEGRVEVVELDVASDDSVSRAAATILERAETVDVVINNAGVTMLGVAEAGNAADFHRVFDVNVFGVVRVVNAFLPAMRRLGDGLLVTVSSLMGRVTIPFAAAYTASKWAVEGLAQTYRYELAPLGIDSVIVEPGAYATGIIPKALRPANPNVADAYGAVEKYIKRTGEAFQEMLSAEPDPQDVADATLRIIDTPRGQRPLRVVVDPWMGDAARALNDANDDIQRAVLERMGLIDLQQSLG